MDIIKKLFKTFVNKVSRVTNSIYNLITAYNLATFLVPILNPLTKSEYTVKDSFQFAEEICEQDPTLSMGSLDVDSLFTNIPLDETIDICVKQLFERTDTVEGFKKSELKQLLCLATRESYFIFNGLLYKQINVVAMGSPLGPSLADAFLSYHEKNWLKIVCKDLSQFFTEVISMIFS